MEAGRREFLERRRAGIGGSDVSAIVGVNKWATPLDVWRSKVGQIEDQGDVPDHIHFGNVLEDVVAQEFQRRTGLAVQRRNKMYVDDQEPCLIANIDRYVTGERAILECKTSSAFMASEWGESGSDEVPDAYICQCLHYMSVTGYQKCYLAVLLGGNDFRTYEIPYNDKLARHLREKSVSFWRDYVETMTPPPPVNEDDLKALYASGGLDPVTAIPEISAHVEILRHLKAEKKDIESQIASAEFAIKEFMGNHDQLLDGSGKVLTTWKACISNRLNTTALKEAEPDLYSQYCETQNQRRFLVK
jgi:putative phage-type endonuclease